MAYWMNMLPHKTQTRTTRDLPNLGLCMDAQAGFLHNCIISNCHMLFFRPFKSNKVHESHWHPAVSSHKEASEAEVFQWSLVTMTTEIECATRLFSLQIVVVWGTQSKRSRTLVKWSCIIIITDNVVIYHIKGYLLAWCSFRTVKSICSVLCTLLGMTQTDLYGHSYMHLVMKYSTNKTRWWSS